MIRRSETNLQALVREWQRNARAAAAALSTADGRWVVVSTTMTALVAGTIAVLAVGAAPPASAGLSPRDHSLLPYQLFMQLAAHSGSNTSFASFAPGGELPSRAQAQRGNILPLDGAVVDEAENNLHPASIDSRTVTLDKGDTLVGALTEQGVSQEDASGAVMAMSSVYNPRQVRAGETFDITFSTRPPIANVISITTANLTSIDASDADETGIDDSMVEPVETTPVGNLLKFVFSPSVDHEITVTRAADGSYSATDEVKKLVARTHRAGATIDSSLYLAAMQAGIPADVVVDMIHMFSYKVDFQRELRPGNSFQVLYDYYYTEDGQPAKQGNISFASMNLGDRTITLYRYQPDPNEPADYFDATGQSAKGFLMKTPVDGARITSGFGMRFHPVLGYSRMHKGIDFGVPIGTPVMAAGAGTVQLEGHLGGYGNYMRINHSNGYSTAYGHLSRFAPGIHLGSHVRQGQIVAYSGNSGMSTGPHLHYEILNHGSQTNPLKVKVAMGRKLSGRDLHKYLDSRIRTDDLIASLPMETRIGDATGDLRTAKAQ